MAVLPLAGRALATKLDALFSSCPAYGFARLNAGEARFSNAVVAMARAEMHILTRKLDGVLAIEFNRPKRKNAFTADMYSSMADAISEGESDSAVRAILFHGKPDVFTAGNDVEDFVKYPPTAEHSPVYRFVDALSGAKKPVLAAVSGPAVGLGTTMLLHCDLVYAGDNARFSLPFTSLGLVPEAGSSYLLPLIAGYQRAAELLLLGETFGPEKAKECGFVTHVLPVAEVLPAAQKAAARLAALPGKSVRTTKALLKRAYVKALDEHRKVEGSHFRAMLTEPAAQEAFAAFAEKRKPDFSRFA
jgi:enoyl-CoA hydratase/carnithine racemase